MQNPTDAAAPLELASRLAGAARSFARGEAAVALGGSYAHGVHDADSDIDLFVFCDEVQPAARRDALAAAIPACEVASWEGGDFFLQAGTDFVFQGRPVSCLIRSSTYIEGNIQAAREGRIRRDYEVGAAMGFFNHCCLADVGAMQVLEDPQGLLAAWKEQVAVYPQALQRAIVTTHLGAARLWPDNAHYQSAVGRGDTVYITAIVQQIVQHIIQLVFALNQRYFPGEKHLKRHMERLGYLPQGFMDELDFLLCPPAAPEAFERQRHILRQTLEQLENHWNALND